MEEDDLLGGDLGQDPDLWVQLQRGGRNQAELNQTGYKGQRLDQGDQEQDRFGGKELQSGPVGEWQTTRTTRELGILLARQLESTKLESRGSSSNRKN